MSALLAELADEVKTLRAEVRDLREALRHALEVAHAERQARELAHDTAARLWRVASSWPGPYPQPIPRRKKG